MEVVSKIAASPSEPARTLTLGRVNMLVKAPLEKTPCVITISNGYALPSAPLIVARSWGTTCSIAFHIFSAAFSFIESTFIAFALLSFGLALGFSFPFWCKAYTRAPRGMHRSRKSRMGSDSPQVIVGMLTVGECFR